MSEETNDEVGHEEFDSGASSVSVLEHSVHRETVESSDLNNTDHGTLSDDGTDYSSDDKVDEDGENLPNKRSSKIHTADHITATPPVLPTEGMPILSLHCSLFTFF
jgi:hypothetical protein